MLKNKEIIDRLTVKQKIELLTNFASFSDPALRDIGVPSVSIKTADELLGNYESGLSVATLARTWDADLVEKIVADAIQSEGEQGTDLLVVPSPKMKIEQLGSEQSEDPILSTTLSLAYLKGAGKSGCMGVVSDYQLRSDEADQLDGQMDRRVFMEYFIRPFKKVAEIENCSALCGSVSDYGGQYGDLNARLLEEAESRIFKRPIQILCEAQTSEETVQAIQKGYVLLSGVPTALELAYEQYASIKQAIEEGRLPMEALEDAYECGSAISDEMLDVCLDRVVEFAKACEEYSKERKQEITPSMLSLRAFEESTVLLKNEKKLLPLSAKKRIAVIGAIATEKTDEESPSFAELFCKSLGNPCVGTASGYQVDLLGRNDDAQAAVQLALQADVVFVFLGDAKKKETVLPANQIALLDALSKYRERVIGVLLTDHAVDMRFDQYVGGLLLASAGGETAAMALANIVSGKTYPSGKLNETYYDAPDEVFEEWKFYKDAGRNKVGPFLGYRRYDSSGLRVRYPFGYGLSYSQFHYSDFSAYNHEISFCVENRGDNAAVELVQIYAGKPVSALPRPEKELKAFVRVKLAPKERRRVQVNQIDLSVFRCDQNRFVSEHGDYNLYVASSVGDVRLAEQIKVGGDYWDSKDGKPSDYLQSRSNILSDSYVMEASCSKMKAHKEWNVAGALALIVGILIGIFSLSGGSSGMFVFALGLIAFGCGFFARGNKEKKKYEAELLEENKRRDVGLFDNAQSADANEIEDLFVEEFDRFVQKKEVRASAKKEDQQFLRVNQDVSISSISQEFGRFALDRGFRLNPETVSAMLASVASSRLIFTDMMSKESVGILCSLIGDYFGCPLYVETITDQHLEGGKLLAVKDSEGRYSITNVAAAISYAKEHADTATFVLLRDVKCRDAEKILTPFVRYFSSPSRASAIDVREINTVYTIPENLWFIVEPSDDQRINEITPCVLEMGSVLRGTVELCDAAETPESYTAVGYYTLRYLLENCKNGFEMREEQGKKIDDVETFVNSYTRYRIGNKLWLQLEKYASVYALCGQEDRLALDCAMASNLIPVLTAVLRGKIPVDGKSLLEEMERLFGEENIAVCHRYIESLGA